MKIGVIIIFQNNESEIDARLFIEQINLSQAIEICLVDNSSNDKTLSLLQDIKESCLGCVSIVEIKKATTAAAAKRAGARYMFNQYNLKHIGFLNVNTMENKGENLNAIMKSLCNNQETLVDFNLKTIERQEVRTSIFKSIFSVVDYLKKINKTNNFNNLNPSV